MHKDRYKCVLKSYIYQLGLKGVSGISGGYEYYDREVRYFSIDGF